MVIAIDVSTAASPYAVDRITPRQPVTGLSAPETPLYLVAVPRASTFALSHWPFSLSASLMSVSHIIQTVYDDLKKKYIWIWVKQDWMSRRWWMALMVASGGAIACLGCRSRPPDAAAPHPLRHAVQSLYNSPRLPRPRTVNYIANIYSRKLRNTRVETLHSSTVRSRTVLFRVRRFIPVLITTFDRCTSDAFRSYLRDLGVRAICSLAATFTPEDFFSSLEPLLPSLEGSDFYRL